MLFFCCVCFAALPCRAVADPLPSAAGNDDSSGTGREVASADWPMWRCSPGRGAATAAFLPADMHLQWVRALPRPEAAWPATQYRLLFDLSYEPVAAAGMLFVPSMVRDSVTAYSAATGREEWRFYADGPVRFAPAIWDGRLFFTSDDGCVYCLDAKLGTLLWKFRASRLDRLVLGNGRFISIHPARGAPVVCDGIVYFAAGIWPFMGTFVHALDGETGKPVWTNSGNGAVYCMQPHSSPAFAGVGPQGYLAVAGDRLIVPGGRSPPACFDRTTGRLVYWKGNSKRGAFSVCVAGKWYFNDGMIHSVADGRAWTEMPVAVADDRTLYGLDDGHRLTAWPREIPIRTVVRRGGKGLEKEEEVLDVQPLWRLDASGVCDRVVIKAGDRLFGICGDKVVAISLPHRGADLPEKAVAAWQAAVDGTPWTMLAAGGRLFVVTREGKIHCFGGEKVEPVVFEADREPVRQTVAGCCFVDGAGTMGPVDEFAAATDGSDDTPAAATAKQVVVIEPDADRIAAFRRKYDAAGIYGKGVHLLPGTIGSVPLPPFMADLVYCRGGGSGDGERRPPGPERVAALFELLRPYGGRLRIAAPDGRERSFAAALGRMGLPGAVVTTGRGEVLIAREGALEGAGSWNHQYGDSANTVFSPDRLVKAPLGLLWFGGPSHEDVLPRHGHGPSPQVAGGRLFIQGIGVISARDVYTGRTLWRREIGGFDTFGRYYDGSYKSDPFDRSYNQNHIPGANACGSNFVTTEDRVYLAAGPVCHVLDAATGETLERLTLPAREGEQSPNFGFIAVDGDRLIAASEPIGFPSGLKAASKRSDDLDPLVAPHAEWSYLFGSHPDGSWTRRSFKAEGWKSGAAGFGFGDDDDTIRLDGMQGKCTTLYARTTFRVKKRKEIAALCLLIRYDDAFVAYLNGREIARAGVTGRGSAATGVVSHEAAECELFEIEGFAGLLRSGDNVLAVEGHNVSLGSSDFTLDPWLGVRHRAGSSPGGTGEGRTGGGKKTVVEAARILPGLSFNAPFATASRTLVVMDRHSGRILWSREAHVNFRHNSIVAGGGRIFCIDRMSEEKLALIKGWGITVDEKAVLYALDGRTGRVAWKKTSGVFGTWLAWSADHDVLLEAGSHSRDRATDEVKKGMAAYRGRDGKELWRNDKACDGPPIVRRDMVITQAAGGTRSSRPGRAFSLLSGEEVRRRHPLTDESIPWEWIRFYGCNTALGSEHLLIFRSASAAYSDLSGGGGVVSLGGFRSGCTSNLIAADGVLSAPDYTRTCSCSYQNQSSLALVHMPGLERWSSDYYRPPEKAAPLIRAGLNLGAPGNRFDGDGTLWLEFPSVGGPSPDPPVAVRCDDARWFRFHNSRFDGALDWVAASGVEGISELRLRVFLQPGRAKGTVAGFDKRPGGSPAWDWGGLEGRFDRPRPFTVRLVFAEPEAKSAGERLFDVALQGKRVLRTFDIAAEGGGPFRTVVREFRGILIVDDLVVALTAREGAPLLCGVAVAQEQ
jgi:outer membrane protein assembly factor BamB